jgi:hypothetical protein
MYTEVIIHHPAPGKGADLRAALEERSKAANAAGSPHLVAQLLYAEEPTFANLIRHDSLAAIDEYGNRRASDPSFQVFLSKTAAADARPPSIALYENLVAAQPTGPVNYALWRTFYPAPGKAGALRAAVEKRAHTSSPGAIGKAVYAQILGADRNHFVLVTLFPSLAGFESYLKAQPSDPSVQAFAAEVGTLAAAGGRSDLYRVTLPFPA